MSGGGQGNGFGSYGSYGGGYGQPQGNRYAAFGSSNGMGNPNSDVMDAGMPSRFPSFQAPMGGNSMGGYNFAQNAQQPMNSQYPNAYGKPQGDPYMGGGVMDAGMPGGGMNFSSPNFGGQMGGDNGGGIMDANTGTSYGNPSGMTGFGNPGSSSGLVPGGGMGRNYFSGNNMSDIGGSGVPGNPSGMTGIQNPGASMGQSAPQGVGPGSQAYQQAFDGNRAQQAWIQQMLQQDPSQQATQLTPPTPDMGKVGTPGGGTPGGNALGNFSGSPNTWLYGPTVGALYPQLQKPQGTPNNFGYFPANGTWGLPPGQS